MIKQLTFLLTIPLYCHVLVAQCPNFSRPGIHVVQSGENLYRIASLYNIPLMELANWNNIRSNEVLYACQELMVTKPELFGYSTEVQKAELIERGGNVNSLPVYVRQQGRKHIIRTGETIQGLARLYGYTEERFREFNLLGPEDELGTGSTILSSDCACNNRIKTYEELAGRGQTMPVDYSNPIDRIPVDEFDNNQIRSASTSDYDSFYDEPQGTYQVGNTLPPAEPAGNRIRSAGASQPDFYSQENIKRGEASTNSVIKATFMSLEEIEMLNEINLVRSNPVGYIPYIEKYKQDILSGKAFGSSIATCDELIAELRQTPSLSSLQPSPCLYNAAKSHGLDQKERGSTGHDGSDGSWPWDRVRRSCPSMSDGNENLVGGPESVREAVILLLVDDGIPSRGHRKTLLNKDWVYAATYKMGKVGYMPNCWVQKFGY